MTTKKENDLLRKLKREGRLVVPRGKLPKEVVEVLKEDAPEGATVAK